ncbi:VanZ family protein [Corynebacterium alimapuense]|nr:VanZ family protein [Corynebacterium alimapuense]
MSMYLSPDTRTRLPHLVTAVLVAGAVISLTLLKGFFSIGGLWDPSTHNLRSVDLVLFNGFSDAPIWYGPILNSLGNVVMFVPVGFLAIVLSTRLAGQGSFAAGGRIRDRLGALIIGVFGALAAGAVLSLTIEITQFVFALGYTDVDDLLWNTLGAGLGGWAAVSMRAELRSYASWVFGGAAALVVLLMLSGLATG